MASQPKAASPSAPNGLISTRPVCPCDEGRRLMGGVSEQFYSCYSFLPSVEGSHQRRPFCWGRSELDGQSCDVHVHVQRKLQSSAQRGGACWFAAGPATQPAPLCAADPSSFLPTLPSLSFSRLGLIFYLFCLSYPLLFPASVPKLVPFLASVQEHRDSLGAHSLAET